MSLIKEDLKVGISDIRKLISTVRETYGFDFSHYAIASFQRRVHRVLTINNFANTGTLIEKIREDQPFFNHFLKEVTVNTTEMFRDPSFWRTLRDEILPALKDQETIRIWHAGCSTGEEVYSLAILMRESGIEKKAVVYASDINIDVIEQAKKGEYSARNMKLNSDNYQRFEGLSNLDLYIAEASERHFNMDPELIKNVRFQTHDLVSKQIISKFDLILCRNVMIYFDKVLQDDVTRLFYESLNKNGFLAIGAKESLQWCSVANKFKVINDKEKIYQVK